jgi:hypothetical protein
MTPFSARMGGAAAALFAISLASAMAQTQPVPPQTSPPPTEVTPKAAVPQPQAAPLPSSNAKTVPDRLLVGLQALSSDGSKLGSILGVKADAEGKTTAIVLKTGGFLGFGGHMVAVPQGKFTRTGDTVQVSMTADEVSKLPATND